MFITQGFNKNSTLHLFMLGFGDGFKHIHHFRSTEAFFNFMAGT